MLTKQDLTFALLLHLMVVVLMVALNQWHREQLKVPERVVQVSMVSLDELKAMMPKPTAPKPIAKPIAKPKPKAKPKPVLQSNVKKRKVAEEELDYDPFAPMESTPKKRASKKTDSKQALNDMLKRQMTDEEINGYIAGMQQAVERQWKVPTEMAGQVGTALVELRLLHSGRVASVRIIESTGSKRLDETLIQAIHAAAPFDIPSQQFALFQTNLIRFHPLK